MDIRGGACRCPNFKKMEDKTKSKKIILSIIITVAVIAIGLVVGFKVIKKVAGSKDSVQKYVTIGTKESADGSSDDSDENTSDEDIEVSIDWNGLKGLNEDIYAYIYVPGTDVSYPILQKEDENDYYLTRDVKGKDDDNGCLYTQVMFDDKAFDDEFTVIYGRNAKDGSMFASLHNFEDYGCFDDNRFFYIYTPEKEYKFEIFAAYTSDDAHLFYVVDKENTMSVQNFIEKIKNVGQDQGIVSGEMVVNFTNKLVVLQTGTGDDATRFNVVGVLVEE